VTSEQQEIARLMDQLAEREREILLIRNSRSWRITRPLREGGDLARRLLRWPLMAPARWALRAVRLAKRMAVYARFVISREGMAGAARKAAFVWRREGGVLGFAKVLRGKALRPSSELQVRVGGAASYAQWVSLYDTLSDSDRAAMRSKMEAFSAMPLISIVMPVYNPKPEWLDEAIRSVKAQLYPHWELCIADDASTDARIKELLQRHAADDDRIKVVYRQANGHISAASNSALTLAAGEWVALMDHDDTLPVHALFWVANEIIEHPDAQLIYSDEDKLDEQGQRCAPYFKCDWNPELMRSHNMVTHLGVYRVARVRQLGGFRVGFEGAQDYDLALRVAEKCTPRQIRHIPRVLYHWRIHAASTAAAGEAKTYAQTAGERAIQEHLHRCGIQGSVEITPFHMYRVRYALPRPLPLVSIIIPTRNGQKLVRQCLDSIFNKTTYAHYEIILVDNGSDDPAALDYFQSLKNRPNLVVLRDDRPFNYSALNNSAVRLARGEFVCLLNNDTEVIAPDWLDEMVGFALQPDVGAVGARLLYSNGGLQHGGVVLGIGGVAGHSHKMLPEGEFGYFGRAMLAQDYSAVTAACLLVRKSVYEQVGGLNETDLAVAFNDVDFCLKLREAGYRNLWTPYAELYHHESVTRGHEDSPEKVRRFNLEVAYMRLTWGDALCNDPAYSPNLSLEREDFSLAWPPRVLRASEIGTAQARNPDRSKITEEELFS
jgi:glycosyltransferase involved in cell wall biosynthesis